MMTTDTHSAAHIDWRWVRSRTITRERIPAAGSGKPSAERLIDAVDESLRLARHLARPVVTTVRKKVLSVQDGSISLDGAVMISGDALSSHLKGSKDTYLFLATIGTDLEDTASMLMKTGDDLHGYLLDRIGSFAAESLAEGFEKELRRKYRLKDMSVSMRFSPGYCDWPLEEQFTLAKVLNYEAAGVRLTESCMMIPKKSISGLVGIAAKGRFSPTKSQCDICNKRGCDYRRNTVRVSG